MFLLDFGFSDQVGSQAVAERLQRATPFARFLLLEAPNYLDTGNNKGAFLKLTKSGPLEALNRLPLKALKGP